MLKLTCVAEGDTLTVHVEGELALETVEEFDAATRHSSAAIRRVTIDCTGLAFLDSTGVNTLLQATVRWMSAGLTVEVANLVPEVHEMLSVLGFFEVLADPG